MSEQPPVLPKPKKTFFTRPSEHRLIVTLEQFDWMQKTVNRKAEQAAVSMVEKHFKKAFKTFHERLAKPPLQEGDLFVVPTTRNDLRILEKLVKEEHSALVTQVIPGYEERANNQPDKRAEFLKYRETAIKRASYLIDLQNKVVQTLHGGGR